MGLMGKEIKKICRDVDFPFLLRDDFLIPVLIRLPIVSLLRFKSVCKYWCTLIETSFFTHLLHTSNSSSSSSSSASNFGTFILQASVHKYAAPFDKYAGLHVETEIIILSSESEESGSGSGSRFRSGPRSGSSGWCWSTDDDDGFQVGKVYGSKDDDGSKEDDDHVFKVDDLVLKLDRLGVPSCYKFSVNYWSHNRVYMVGSCNGLICLSDIEHKKVTLWNPATRQFRILPKSITTIEKPRVYGDITCVIGFGFDIKTKDYKVVLLGNKNVVQVYSLSTDSWRVLEGIHSLPGRLMLGLIHGLYVNGSCFFMATYDFPVGNNRWFLVSFDFTKEIITTMEFPDRNHDDHMTQGFYLTYFGDDKMALFVLRPPPHGYYHDYDYENCDYDYNDCDIWVLNEHHGMNKVEESWTKLHSFQMKKRVYEKIIPRGISNNGEFALLQAQAVGPLGSHRYGLNRKMKLYNLVTKETKKEFLSCSSVMSGAAVYKPSIVSIKGGQA